MENVHNNSTTQQEGYTGVGADLCYPRSPQTHEIFLKTFDNSPNVLVKKPFSENRYNCLTPQGQKDRWIFHAHLWIFITIFCADHNKLTKWAENPNDPFCHTIKTLIPPVIWENPITMKPPKKKVSSSQNLKTLIETVSDPEHPN
jgi:hypothetical protein